ncbi:MAG: 30S ribosomal protein S8 [Candidatus Vogelbacteria bacterium CG10_big_fil_rev_8_21_14_0_10_49_38]|uniref:Small ribosomal subunit protein uS8 n=1 Tax=Candidatus Vogelbacteria bacterium CG10_big_fil_rev_8_21_14_0_10_49_38 TaxID=1975043 RepID=A0A2H0RIJ1_9BACT|nr:MAG: 30S ribosomal protein S8 [bacterium CG10_49_38]PIR46382.1 MAG: 30S ribosomal protein S8 [Candidatus Vogelbacteria bacterium CG10_big_fil_rev_8_21_14_0_10_49_38]
MVTDPISDFIIQLKNGGAAKREIVTVPASNVKQAIAETLVRHGWLAGVVKRGKKVKKFLACELVYLAGKPKIKMVKRISKPSRRVYVGANEIKSVRQGFGLTVLSTPQGVLTDKEARQAKVGGEVLFEIY